MRPTAVELRVELVGQLGKVWVNVDPSTAVLARQSSPKVEARIDETVTFHAVNPWDEMEEGGKTAIDIAERVAGSCDVQHS